MGGLRDIRRLSQQGFVTDWMEGVREEERSVATFQFGFLRQTECEVGKIGVKGKVRIIIR